MPLAGQSESLLRPEPNRKQVTEALNRILHSPIFAGSRRCQDLLKFMVLKRLDGDTGVLKERLIAAELFGRDLDYDTSSDAIVRVKANEVRKRLAAYYGEFGRHEPFRIDIPVGSYIPVFRWLEENTQPVNLTAGSEGLNGRQEPAEPSPPSMLKWPFAPRRAAAAIALVVTIFTVWFLFRPVKDDYELFWAPFYQKEPVLICVPARDRWIFDPPVAQTLAQGTYHGAVRLDLQLQPGNIAFIPNGELTVQNFQAAVQLAIHLAHRGVKPEVRMVSEVTAENIRRRHVILLGAYHNPWASKLSSGMRYIFESEGEGSREATWIRDRNSTGEPRWKVARLWPHAVQKSDYAIISRTLLPPDGQIVVTVAGINGFGTQVAAEFLTAPQYWKEIRRLAPRGWQYRNSQIVLETDVIRLVPNPPRVLAVHVW